MADQYTRDLSGENSEDAPRDLTGRQSADLPEDVSQEGGRATSTGDDKNAPQDETMHPALQAFSSVIPSEVGAKQWVSDVTTRINDWLMGREIGDRAQAHAEEYTANIGKFKDGLLNMVKNDPTTVTLARDLVPQTVAHLLPSNMSEEQHARVWKEVGGHIQNEIVNQAVTSMADRSPVLARRMLDSTVGDLLSPEQKQSLTGYITAQSLAKQGDQAAAAQKQAVDSAAASSAAAHAYGEQLINPGTGAFSPANGWASRLIADPSVATPDKGALMGAFGRLQQNGDIAESNSTVIHDALKQMKAGTLSTSDIMNATGVGQSGLSMQDAHMLNGMLQDNTPEGRAKRETLLNALDDAKSKLAGQAGENGAVGARAFDNYGKWLMGAYRSNGMAGFDPNNKDAYLFRSVGLNQFADTPKVYNMPSDRVAPTRSIGAHFRGARRR